MNKMSRLSERVIILNKNKITILIYVLSLLNIFCYKKKKRD